MNRLRALWWRRRVKAAAQDPDALVWVVDLRGGEMSQERRDTGSAQPVRGWSPAGPYGPPP